MSTETVLTDERIFALGAEIDITSIDPKVDVLMFSRDEFLAAGRAIEQAVLQSLTGNADRIEVAARMLSKCLDYPWEYMTSQGHDSMRGYARATINAAIEERP